MATFILNLHTEPSYWAFKLDFQTGLSRARPCRDTNGVNELGHLATRTECPFHPGQLFFWEQTGLILHLFCN